MSKADKVGQALRELEEASRGSLVAQWRRHYRSEPPRYASVEFMRQTVAAIAPSMTDILRNRPNGRKAIMHRTLTQRR